MLCHVDLSSNTLDVWVCRDRWDDVVDESVCLFICLMSVLCSATRSMFFTVTFLADVSLSLPVFLSVSVSLCLCLSRSLSLLHTHTHTQVNNPYQVVLRNICKSLSAFDDDNQIPCYGFGCASSRNSKVGVRRRAG